MPRLGQTPLIQVTVKGPTRGQVARAANALASQLAFQLSSGARQKIAIYQQQVDADDAGLKIVNEALAKPDLSTTDKILLQGKLQTLQSDKTLTAQLLISAKTVEAARIVTYAAPEKTSARNHRNSTAVGALIGLILGGIAALLWDPIAAVSPPRSVTRVSFIVPAYNEAATIAEVLERVEALDLDKQIVVVDDGSTDDTPRVLEEWARPQRHPGRPAGEPRQGRGDPRGDPAARRRHHGDPGRGHGVRPRRSARADRADPPRRRPTSSSARGCRGGRPQRAYLFWHLVGNRFLSLLTNVLYNTTLSDMETGYKAFRTDVLRSLDLREDDFAIEPEITAKVCKRDLRVYELPISYYGRTYAEGKKITWRDGFKAMFVLLRVRFRD